MFFFCNLLNYSINHHLSDFIYTAPAPVTLSENLDMDFDEIIGSDQSTGFRFILLKNQINFKDRKSSQKRKKTLYHAYHISFRSSNKFSLHVLQWGILCVLCKKCNKKLIFRVQCTCCFHVQHFIYHQR